MFPLTTYPHLVHALFEMMAITAGAFYYRRIMQRDGFTNASLLSGGRFAVLLGCIAGAALGNKLVFWLEVPHLFPLYWNKPEIWFAGQSMVGGLLGGLIGVELAKKISGITQSTGDNFVYPILLGIIIGRTGCFIAGLDDGTYGLPTSLAWGIDFGDGITRHPTQLYEIAYAIGLWFFLRYLRLKIDLPAGYLFKIMLSSYLAWRLLIDDLKPLPYEYAYGLSGIQVTCAIALLIYLPISFRKKQIVRVSA